MLYINEDDIKKVGVNWDQTIDVIESAVICMKNTDYSQPVKPYLRYRNLKNRIIAMPAFVGGEFDIAGIKWIASFPDNINNDIPRANSVTILNNANTGVPIALFNTPLLSIIRTASVSGLIIKYFLKERELENINLGIVGFGPIGRYHLNMCKRILGERLNSIKIYDIKNIDENDIDSGCEINIVDSWQEAYENSDIFITCTVAKDRYIDLKPLKGSLQLNVSLRDYTIDVYDYVKNSIIVDDWEEVCRENTDIEVMHKEKGLDEENVYSILDVVDNNVINFFDDEQTIMFNPMGMGVFDIAIGSYYYGKVKGDKLGLVLS